MLRNWKVKVGVQCLLALCPRGEQINYFLQVLNDRHKPENINRKLRSYIEKIALINNYDPIEGCLVVEIGTGWKPIATLLFYLMGAKTIYTYDHVRHVRFELVKVIMDEMERDIEYIQKKTNVTKSVLENRLKRIRHCTTADEILESAGIVYKAPADAQKTGLDSHSIDIIFSTSVLEHVPENVIHGFMEESRRIIKPDGIVYHFIGCRDHYASHDRRISFVNYYKYPEWLWRIFCKNRIRYQNRLCAFQYMDIFKSYGAKLIHVRNIVVPESLEVLKNLKVNKRFAHMSHEQLAVAWSELIFSL
jgi:SAM-dependent methyltransferase